MIKGIDNIVGQAREKVNHEPTFKVIHANDFGIRDNFSSRTNKSCMEVEHDVNEKDDINDAVNDGIKGMCEEEE